MAKFTLTPDGVQAKQDELYKLDDSKLRDQARVIAKDSIGWLTESFELSKEQQEYVKQLPEDFSLPLGWQVASIVIGRQPFKLDPIPENITQASNSKKKTELTLSGSTTVNPTNGQTTFTLNGGIKWTL